jgi:hypothetical protein
LDINTVENDKNIDYGNPIGQEHPHHENETTNNKGLNNTVITVTAVTRVIEDGNNTKSYVDWELLLSRTKYNYFLHYKYFYSGFR